MLIAALAAFVRASDDDAWWQREPIGIYAGWLTAASSVSIGLVLAGYGYTTQDIAAYVSLSIALIIAVAMQKACPKSLSYPIAVIWALVGIVVSNLEPLNTSVVALCAVGIGYLLIGLIKAHNN
jgi:small-conductance mechanosensitive channel